VRQFRIGSAFLRAASPPADADTMDPGIRVRAIMERRHFGDSVSSHTETIRNRNYSSQVTTDNMSRPTTEVLCQGASERSRFVANRVAKTR